MKTLLHLIVYFFLLTSQNTAFAIILKNTDSTFETRSASPNIQYADVAKVQKPPFLQKWLMNKVSNKLKTKTFAVAKGEKPTGDSLAKTGFWFEIISSLGALLGLILLFSGVGSDIFLLLLGLGLSLAGLGLGLIGLISCIDALSHNDITPKGKKLALFGIVTYSVFAIITLVSYVLLVID